MPEPGRRPSTGITRLRRYHAPLRRPHGPRLTISDHLGLMAATHYLCGSRTLPRKPCAHADPTTPAEEDGLFGRLLHRLPHCHPLREVLRFQPSSLPSSTHSRKSGVGGGHGEQPALGAPVPGGQATSPDFSTP